jgi:lipid-A-disaccharide synthase-like uncharacterized protein
VDSILGADSSLWTLLWRIVGVSGAVIFFGRFYIQWIVSERAGRSVMPVVFWYMSGAGSVALLLYGVFYLHSPVAALSYGFNSVVYSRNLVHIWNEKGTLTRRASMLFQGTVGLFLIASVVMVAGTWLNEYHHTHHETREVIVRTWFWIGVGVVGQSLFAARFAVQWVVTEVKKRSVIPPSFWYLSIAASLLLMSSYTQRQEWLNAAGMVATLPVYVRNVMLIRAGRATADE